MQFQWASPGSSLWEAANTGDLQLLRRELLKPDVDIDVCDGMMRTPLIEAAKYGHPECVRELLIAGANPDHRAFLGPAIDYASDPSSKQMLREASAAKARGVRWSGEPNATCRLWEASKSGDLELLRSVLADPNVDLEVQDGYEKTPLIAAVELDIPGSVRELLLAGANPDHGTMLGKVIDYTKNSTIAKMLQDASKAKARGAKWDGGVKSGTVDGSEGKESRNAQQGRASNANTNLKQGEASNASVNTQQNQESIGIMIVKEEEASNASVDKQHGEASNAISRRAAKSREFRSQPCRYFQRGNCRYGDACRFVHDKAAVSDTPGPNLNPPRGTAVCRNWLEGRCKYGDNCRFIHPGKKPTSVGSGSNVKEDEEEDEEETDEDDELEQRMRNCGFTDEEAWELMSQGVKPWDPDAWDVLAALSDDSHSYYF